MFIWGRGSLKFCLVELKIAEIISAYYLCGLAGALPILDKSGSFWSINTISTKRKGNCYEDTN